jgi:hypothetical protein
MRKTFYFLSIFALIFMFAACGSSPKEDGIKLAKKHCECAKLESNGTDVQLNDCDKEYKAMKKEFKKKYQDDEMARKQFEEGRESFHCDE